MGADENHGNVEGGFVAISLGEESVVFKYYDEKANVLWTSAPKLARVYTPYTGTSTTTTFIPDVSECREWEWPDVKGNWVCGTCMVLVDNWDSKYRNCDGYCNYLGRGCVDAWEESGDTCKIKWADNVTCSTTSAEMDTSDAICQCTGTKYTGTTTTTTTASWIPDTSPCVESEWPDLDHDLVCGPCKVFVDKFDAKYKTCNGYCNSINRFCVGAWEEVDDTCAVDSTETCDTQIPSSDAI